MINGFLCVNKPKGITSFDVIKKLRRITGIKKIGHAGTLDPLAHGVLVVALNEATKLIDYVMRTEKEYNAELIFGYTSDTYDADGEILPKSEVRPTIEEIQAALTKFDGEIDQVPPKFSALKINGKRAYDLARKGEEVEMKSRKVIIHEIKMLKYMYPSLIINVKCGKGTYIRSIAHDLGALLHVGAYLKELERAATGGFHLDDSVTLEDLEKGSFEDYLMPLEKAVSKMERIDINPEDYAKLVNGMAVKLDGLMDLPNVFAGFFEDKLVGILEKFDKVGDGMIKFRRKLNI